MLSIEHDYMQTLRVAISCCNKLAWLVKSLLGQVFQPLETIIRDELIPALTGKHSVSEEIRNLLTLPVRLGGLGIVNPVQQAQSHYQASKNITSTISLMLKEQAITIPPEMNEAITTAKKVAKAEKRVRKTKQYKNYQRKEAMICNGQ